MYSRPPLSATVHAVLLTACDAGITAPSFTSLTMRGSRYLNAPTQTCAKSGGQLYCWGLLPEPLTFEE